MGQEKRQEMKPLKDDIQRSIAECDSLGTRAMVYDPKPIDTSQIRLNAELIELIERGTELVSFVEPEISSGPPLEFFGTGFTQSASVLFSRTSHVNIADGSPTFDSKPVRSGRKPMGRWLPRCWSSSSLAGARRGLPMRGVQHPARLSDQPRLHGIAEQLAEIPT
jgi:hypothetical protein